MTAVATRPLLKGWSHLLAAVAAITLCPILIALSPDGTRVPAAIFSAGVIALFTVSGLFHRVQWSPRPHKIMQALDHSMIFIVIAATYTPIAAVALPQPQGKIILILAWVGAIAGVVLNLAWPDAPRAVVVAPYLVVGWLAAAVVVDVWRALGVAGFILLVSGGLLHSIGAVIYARKRPDPWPTVFGFHEVFHLFVIGGIACHYVVVAFFALR
ncbi:UNVERIFIED_CONTAM: hypothetical protein GTU68_003587 [Idotea baltica]|nr:hypothetical protein [Idotea baltica]